MSNGQEPNDWSTGDWNTNSWESSTSSGYVQGAGGGYPHGSYDSGTGGNQQGRRSNTGLYAVIGILLVALAAVLGIGGGILMSNKQPSDADPDSVAASSQKSEQSASELEQEDQKQPQTFTETKTIEATEPESTSQQSPKNPTTTRKRSDPIFSGPGISAYREQITANGWSGTPARCGSGYYARVVAHVSDAVSDKTGNDQGEGFVTICESHSGDRYYVGYFPAVSGDAGTYPISSFSNSRTVAKNGSVEYVLTQDNLYVDDSGSPVLSGHVDGWGLLQAG